MTDLYGQAYRIRAFEEELRKRYDPDPATAKIKCPVHFSIGQEMCAAAVCAVLRPQDRVFASHRNHHWYLAKGGDMKAMVAELYGMLEGCCGGRGGSMHLADAKAHVWSFPIVGDCVSVAVGSALAIKMSGEDALVVAAFGDAALETGQFWEAVNFTALHKLRVFFVCENNGYATQTPLRQRQPRSLLTNRVKSFMDAYAVADFAAGDVYDHAGFALERLPMFLEISTYRLLEHVGPNSDDELGYRTQEEVKRAREIDPIEALAGKLDPNEVLQIERLADQEVEEAFATVPM